MRSRVMYIQKFGGLGSRQGRIGRVYYKTNYFDTETGTQVWISGARRDGGRSARRRLSHYLPGWASFSMVARAK
jgi:hypothetical protein